MLGFLWPPSPSPHHHTLQTLGHKAHFWICQQVLVSVYGKKERDREVIPSSHVLWSGRTNLSTDPNLKQPSQPHTDRLAATEDILLQSWREICITCS